MLKSMNLLKTLKQKVKKVDDIITHFWTHAELQLGFLAGFIWSWFNFALGGIDAPIKALAILIILDFITGVSAAYKKDEVSSAIGARGIRKKVGIFICVMLANLLDTATNMNMFRGMVITGFAIIEGMSLIENVDRLGYGDIIPEFLRGKMIQIEHEKNLKEDSDKWKE